MAANLKGPPECYRLVLIRDDVRVRFTVDGVPAGTGETWRLLFNDLAKAANLPHDVEARGNEDDTVIVVVMNTDEQTADDVAVTLDRVDVLVNATNQRLTERDELLDAARTVVVEWWTAREKKQARPSTAST
jgi:hypothetical protein